MIWLLWVDAAVLISMTCVNVDQRSKTQTATHSDAVGGSEVPGVEM